MNFIADETTGELYNASTETLLRALDSSPQGLSYEQAEKALGTYGPNALKIETIHPRLKLILAQCKSPITILLASAALLSAIVGERFDGCVILFILLVSGALGYWQELRAYIAIQTLLQRLENRVTVLRDGSWKTLPSTILVPGDVISILAGSRIPADCRLLSAKDLAVDQSTLTGESFPCEKNVDAPPSGTAVVNRNNCIFAGSHVVSGEGTAVVIATGQATMYGAFASSLRKSPAPTEFELGVRNFGYLLLEVAATLSLIVFAINISFERPILDVLLFTLALVVGMTPQLLPAIATTTLAQGAHRMARSDVLVRRLHSIADLGGISILCTDKTGTLTEGAVVWHSSILYDGTPSAKTALYAYLNALHETGFSNVIDDTLRATPQPGAAEFLKIDEIPYDFTRRLLSVTLELHGERTLITKGAVKEVLSRSDSIETSNGDVVPIGPRKDRVISRFEELSSNGYRCLGVAYRSVPQNAAISKDLENSLTFLGIICFSDPLKPTALESIQALEAQGITCKVVTGDNRFVAAKLANDLKVLSSDCILTGDELDTLSDGALQVRAREVDIFAEVNPNQKERIILALKKSNLGVGYMGDGINDAAALRAGDVGISVDTAADVTKEAADIVLLNKDLLLLLTAVKEGRRAFANTLKYIMVTTSANFGNMFSVAGASLFADFLPMLPPQILLLNVLSDLPAMAIATDRVDEEMTARPIRWNSRSIASFMLVFGLISSVFDYLTFAILLILGLPAPAFRTGWFIESVLSEICILLVVRTERPLRASRPGAILTLMCSVAAVITVYLPFSPVAYLVGLSAPSPGILCVVAGILLVYTGASEGAKRVFLKR